jgi:hypothetical protein
MDVAHIAFHRLPVQVAPGDSAYSNGETAFRLAVGAIGVYLCPNFTL